MKVRQGLTFDDVLLVPKHSSILTRNMPLNVSLGKGIDLTAPIVSANMKNITGDLMARAIGDFGGLALLHRFAPLEEQITMFKKTVDWFGYSVVGCSVGVKDIDKKHVDSFVDVGSTVLCVDVAHGDHTLALNMVEYIAKKHPDVLLIAGNVATAGGARRLYNAGADVIKVGIGSGSLCSTRIETGNGVPQMTALEDVFIESCEIKWDKETNSYHSPFDLEYRLKDKRKFKIIADGGLRSAGDCLKALCFSDAVMLGSMLAGTDETPGDVTVDVQTGQRFKIYAGSSTHKANRIEGVIRKVPCRGPVKPILTRICEGIQSGLSYQGCTNLDELKKDPEFIQISNAGLVESHPHSF